MFSLIFRWQGGEGLNHSVQSPAHRLHKRFRKGQGLWNGASHTEEPTSPSRKDDIFAKACLSQAHEPRSLDPHPGGHIHSFFLSLTPRSVSDGFFWTFCLDLLTWHQLKGKTKQTSIYCGKKSWVFIMWNLQGLCWSSGHPLASEGGKLPNHRCWCGYLQHYKKC